MTASIKTLFEDKEKTKELYPRTKTQAVTNNEGTNLDSLLNELETEINTKIDKPTDTPTVGKVLKIKSVNEDGTFVCEWANDESGLSDVQVNGTSIVADGVAVIPIVGYETYGVARVNADLGISTYTNSAATYYAIRRATNDNIDARTSLVGNYRPIVPSNLVYAVNSVLCSTSESEQLTSDEQLSARQRIGLEKEWALKGALTTENKDVGVNVDLSGCTEIWLMGVVSATSSSNIKIGALNLISGLIVNGDRVIAIHVIDTPFGITADVLKYATYNGAGTNPVLSSGGNAYLYALREPKYFVKDATSVTFTTDTITSCNIEIYAR